MVQSVESSHFSKRYGGVPEGEYRGVAHSQYKAAPARKG